MTRLNFYVAFDNVYDEIDTLISGQNTRIPRADNREMPVWDFSHLENMRIYPGRNLNQSLNLLGVFPMEYITTAFVDDETKPEVNFILRLLSSNLNFNQLSMRAVFNNCPIGTRFFLVNPIDKNPVYAYYTDLYNSISSSDDIDSVTFRRKSRLFGSLSYSESDIIEAIDGAYNRADNFFTANESGQLGFFTADTYQNDNINQSSNLNCRLLIKE